MATFYQLRNDSRCIMVEAVDYWQENDTMYCVHFQGGDYMEMRSAEFNEFIKDYYEVKLTFEAYKEKFCKPATPVEKGKVNIALNHAIAEIATARDIVARGNENFCCDMIYALNHLIGQIDALKFNL